MYFIYTLLLAVGLFLAAPYYVLHFRRYAPSLRDRLGSISTPQLRRSIWVHAVSVGEVKAIQRLLERLRADYPNRKIVVSTTTPAGQQLARERTDLIDHAFYFPFDFAWIIRKVLNRIDPEFVIIAETEIWPNFLRVCRERNLRVYMVNGRISDRSLPRYRLIRSWLKRVLDDYAVLGMQSEIDRLRIEMLGANEHKVTVFGNLKYDALAANRPLEPAFASVLETHSPLWIAASTHPGEEEFILNAFQQVRAQQPQLTLLIAPRRPERFEEVAKLIQTRGFTMARRSALSEGANVLLLDTIGELTSAFEFATVVFVGGTLIPHGGHNILEPAQFAKPIIIGPHMQNFREMTDLFLGEKALIQIQSPAELASAVSRVLQDSAMAAELGRKAREIVRRNVGATERVMKVLQLAGGLG